MSGVIESQSTLKVRTVVTLTHSVRRLKAPSPSCNTNGPYSQTRVSVRTTRASCVKGEGKKEKRKRVDTSNLSRKVRTYPDRLTRDHSFRNPSGRRVPPRPTVGLYGQGPSFDLQSSTKGFYTDPVLLTQSGFRKSPKTRLVNLGPTSVNGVVPVL